jgi:hypothetical protein
MCDILPAYNNIDRKIRVELKRKVKDYLRNLLGESFNSCIIKFEKNGVKHHSYGVKQDQIPQFKVWAVTELRGYGLY